VSGAWVFLAAVLVVLAFICGVAAAPAIASFHAIPTPTYTHVQLETK
jgi:hypothetical protein